MDSLLAAHPETFIVIQYHSWWPDEADPFYLANEVENKSRIHYYPEVPEWVYYVPRLFIDGIIDAEYNSDFYETILSDREQVDSPLAITLEPSYGKLKAIFSAHGHVNQTYLVARFVVTESYLQFNGSDGTQLYNQTMRDMIPDTSGIPLVLQQGKSVELTTRYTLQEDWVAENCNMVVFVQSEETREVLQAAQCPVGGIFVGVITAIEQVGNGDGKPDPGETVGLTIVLDNQGPEATDIEAYLSTSDPTIVMQTSQVRYNDIPAWSSGDNSNDPFVFGIAEHVETHYSDFDLTVVLNSGADTVGITFTMVIPRSSVLFVEDAAKIIEAQMFYKELLDDVEGAFDQWSTARYGSPDATQLGKYEVVVWHTEGAGATLSEEEQAQLSSFLDNGGRLFLCGDDIAADLQSSTFLGGYLHAGFVTGNSEDLLVSGVEGDVISTGVSLMSIGGVGGVNEQPDVIVPLEGAIPVFNYFTQGGTAALRYGGDYKVVYFAFDFEGIIDFYNVANSPALRANLMQKILTYLKLDFTPQIGDVNEDGTVNILDVLFVINIVLGIHSPTPGQEWAADVNEDGTVNVLDAIALVNIILG